MAYSILKLNPETNSIIIWIASLLFIPRFAPTPQKKASENSEVLKSEQVVSVV